MDQHDGLVPVDARQTSSQGRYEIEAVFLPVTWKVMTAVQNRSILVDQSRAADSHERSEPELRVERPLSEVAGHLGQAREGLVARSVRRPDGTNAAFSRRRPGRVVLALPEFDDTHAKVGAANVGGNDRIMLRQYPPRGELCGPDQAGLVGMIADRNQFERNPFAGEQDLGASHRKLADMARTQSASDHDALGFLPAFETQKAAHHRRELMGKLLDGGMDETGRNRVGSRQDLVERRLR